MRVLINAGARIIVYHECVALLTQTHKATVQIRVLAPIDPHTENDDERIYGVTAHESPLPHPAGVLSFESVSAVPATSLMTFLTSAH